MAKLIELTRGYVTLVDDEDYARLITRKWYTQITTWGDIYAKSMLSKKETGTGARREIAMHRYILGVVDPLVEVDHIDGNTLNNQKSNLRFANSGENSRNRGKNKNNKSGFKGVYWGSNVNKWRAIICVDYKKINLGCFDTPEEAHEAYKEAALLHHGRFAKSG